MTAMLPEIADAITAELNARQWPLEFTAVRSYADWDLSLPDSTDTLVDVVPVSRKKTAGKQWRDKRDHELTVHVGIRRKFAPEVQDPTTGRIPNAQVDALIELAEAFELHFEHPDEPAPDGLAVTFVSAELLGDYDRDLLYENRQFLSVLELKYRNEVEISDATIADLLEDVA